MTLSAKNAALANVRRMHASSHQVARLLLEADEPTLAKEADKISASLFALMGELDPSIVPAKKIAAAPKGSGKPAQQTPTPPPVAV